MATDLVRDPHEDRLGRTGALPAVRGGVADVAASDVGCTLDGEGDHVGEFAAPTYWGLLIVGVNMVRTDGLAFGV